MTKEEKHNLTNNLKKGAAIVGAITTIQAFLLWLFMPHIDDYAEAKIGEHEKSKAFETRVFEVADLYIESPNFKIKIIHMQQEFEEKMELRLKKERE